MDCVAAWIGNCAGMGDLAIKTALLLCPSIDPLCIGLALRELISPVIPRLNEIAASVRSMLEGLGGLAGG